VNLRSSSTRYYTRLYGGRNSERIIARRYWRRVRWLQNQQAYLNHLIDERIAESQSLGVVLSGGIAVFETSLESGISPSDTFMTLVSTSNRGGGSLSG
jgi:hypothetical protein